MEEMHRVMFGVGGEMELPSPFQEYQPPSTSMYSPTWMLSELHSLEVLWRLHYVGMLD